ncbi:MAG TPA: hypothetical protein PL074_03520, partial [Thermoflexales bacterium]|nr:hypothetical protein [Thermoflexales bacterium]
ALSARIYFFHHMKSRKFIALIVLPTLIYIGFLLFYPNRDLLILWERTPPNAPALAATAALLLGYGALAWRIVQSFAGVRASRRQLLALFALVFMGGLALHIAITAMAEDDALVAIAQRTYAWKAGGYWTVGSPITNIADFIGNYAARSPTYPVHQMRHPPGLSLIFTAGSMLFNLVPGLAAQVANWFRPYSCNSLLSVNSPSGQMAGGLFGMLMEFALAMLPVIPLFALVRRLAGQKAAAWSAVFYMLMPGMGIWVAQLDRGFNLATALVLYFVERMVTERSLRHALLCGLVLSVATFASFGAAPIALIGAVYALVRLFQTAGGGFTASRLPSLLAQAALVVLGALSVWLFCWLAFGLNPITLYKAIFDSHLGIDFPFWPFVFWHPWDAITFIGVPLAVVALAGWRKAAPLTAAFWVPLAALSLMHVARGETGRVWMFFGAVACAAAAVAITQRGRNAQLALLGALSVQTLVMGAVLKPMIDIGIPPQKHESAQIPSNATLVDTRFGASGQIALLGYWFEPLKQGRESRVHLFWQRKSDAPLDASFKSFVHVAQDETDQARVAQTDSIPVGEKYPTTCWKKDEVVEDTQYFAVSPNAGAGPYPVFIGLYDPATGQRPPTFASAPSKQMYGSVLVPDKVSVQK